MFSSLEGPRARGTMYKAAYKRELKTLQLYKISQHLEKHLIEGSRLHTYMHRK